MHLLRTSAIRFLSLSNTVKSGDSNVLAAAISSFIGKRGHAPCHCNNCNGACRRTETVRKHALLSSKHNNNSGSMNHEPISSTFDGCYDDAPENSVNVPPSVEVGSDFSTFGETCMEVEQDCMSVEPSFAATEQHSSSNLVNCMMDNNYVQTRDHS